MAAVSVRLPPSLFPSKKFEKMVSKSRPAGSRADRSLAGVQERFVEQRPWCEYDIIWNNDLVRGRSRIFSLLDNMHV
jgi:hypothetical protein